MFAWQKESKEQFAWSRLGRPGLLAYVPMPSGNRSSIYPPGWHDVGLMEKCDIKPAVFKPPFNRMSYGVAGTDDRRCEFVGSVILKDWFYFLSCAIMGEITKWRQYWVVRFVLTFINLSWQMCIHHNGTMVSGYRSIFKPTIRLLLPCCFSYEYCDHLNPFFSFQCEGIKDAKQTYSMFSYFDYAMKQTVHFIRLSMAYNYKTIIPYWNLHLYF